MGIQAVGARHAMGAVAGGHVRLDDERLGRKASSLGDTP